MDEKQELTEIQETKPKTAKAKANALEPVAS